MVDPYKEKVEMAFFFFLNDTWGGGEAEYIEIM